MRTCQIKNMNGIVISVGLMSGVFFIVKVGKYA